MILLFTALLVTNPGNRLNASLYTFHRIGGYSVSDLFLNYEFDRYNARLTLEDRQNAFGIRSLGLDIDSVFRACRLTLGEKNYHLNMPVSSALDLWGLALTSHRFDVFAGRIKDPGSTLPISFENNRYTAGFRYGHAVTPRLPVEFLVLDRNDSRGPILNNLMTGATVKYHVRENIFSILQAGTSLSDLGFGGSFAWSANYTGQRYGGHAYFKNIMRNYAAATNTACEPGNWFQLTSYAKPLEWLNLGQEFAYSTSHDIGLGLSWAVSKAPLPPFGYGVNYNRRTELIGQNVNAGWSFKKFSAAADYAWSANARQFNLQLRQEIRAFQFWTALQVKDVKIWQMGCILPLMRKIRLKTYANFVYNSSLRTRTNGFELSANPAGSVKFNGTYEVIAGERNTDHSFSLGLSNTLAFDRIGLSSVTGVVFIDKNGNSLYDNGDTPAGDLEILLDGRTPVRTNGNGRYRFDFVQSGEHTVQVNLGTLPANISSEKSRYTVNTGLLGKARLNVPIGELGSIEGRIYYDDDKNGERDGGEKGAVNVVVAINGFVTTTNEQGKFRFANLMAGVYNLEIKLLPPGTVLSAPAVICVSLAAGEKLSMKDIGLYEKDRPVKKTVFGKKPRADTVAVVPPLKKTAPPASGKPPVLSTDQQAEIETLYQRGAALFGDGRYTLALKVFKQVLALDPGHKRAREYLKRTEKRIEAMRGK